MVVTHQQLDPVGVYPNSSGCERIESDTKVEDKKRKEQPGPAWAAATLGC